MAKTLTGRDLDIAVHRAMGIDDMFVIPAYRNYCYPLALEWLAANGVVVILSTTGDGGWECELNGYGAMSIVRAATAGEAVCLALLAYVEKTRE